MDDGDAVVVATSGSTGEPRGVVLTHAALAASAAATSRRLGVDPGRHRWLACLPWPTSAGWPWSPGPSSPQRRSPSSPGFDAAEVERIGRAGGATHVSLVATALARIDPAAFETVLLGGAAPPGALPANVVTTYGMTETGSGVVYDGVPLDGVEVAVGTGDEGGGPRARCWCADRCCCAATATGPTPPWPAPTAPGAGSPPATAGGWCDGRLEVDGRLAEVVVTGGEKVWPAAVERVLADAPRGGRGGRLEAARPRVGRAGGGLGGAA